MLKKNEIIEEKILEVGDNISLMHHLSKWSSQKKRLVFTNGCFDILHLGHVDYLSRAADMGDVLLVGLNTDASVKRLKGADRPVFNQQARARVLASLFFVDLIVLFDEDTPYELIKKIQPDVLVKGSDYRPEEIVGYDMVTTNKGEVIAIDFLEGYSTSALIDKLRK